MIHLSTLALTHDKWYEETKLSISPKWTDKMSADASKLSDEEKERIVQMIEDARFSTTAVLDNFDARLGMYMPPMGYAAVWNAAAIFDADVFDHNVFRGVAGVTTTRKKAPTNVHALFAKLNAVIGDASPVPPVSSNPPGNWVCSLGSNAWIGLYQSNSGKQGLVAVVVAGLDHASWLALRTDMRAWHRKITVSEAYVRLQKWAELAAANRRRLLGTFLRALGDSPAGDQQQWIEVLDATYAARATSFVDADGWLDKMRVPEWFVFPSRLPTHCPPHAHEYGVGIRADPQNRETYPFEIRPEFDVVMDDLCLLRENEFVRMSGCCSSKKTHTAVVAGPMDDIYLTKHAEPTPLPDTHDALPAQAIQRIGGLVSALKPVVNDEDRATAVWEDPELLTNRLIESTYDFRGAARKDDENDRRVTSLTPILVRVSCRDSTARAEPEVAVSKRRLASLALDDYVPISR